MPKSDSTIKNNYMCILVEQIQAYRKKKSVDSITVAMVVMMTSYFVFAVGL